MALSKFERMLQLADEVFAVHNDPSQLNVDEDILEQLRLLHPATVSEFIDDDGPVCWVLVIPSSQELIKKFADKKISETELLSQTKPGDRYDALYLCSAMVLEEYRRKGLANIITSKAIREIRKDHPIQLLCTWNFSKEGAALAQKIAKQENLPLLVREKA